MVPSDPVFGFSLSELIVVIVVALVVIGPKDLPKMLRKLGQYSGKLRRMASDLRAQSGIDEALRTEGLADDIAEIRKLARGELDAVQRAAVLDPSAIAGARPPELSPYRDDFFVVRDREYPRDGADSYGALPDNAIVYAEGLPKSKLARDPLYILGDPAGTVPEPPPVPGFPDLLPGTPPIEAKAHADAHAAAHAEATEEPRTPPDTTPAAETESESAEPPAPAERPATEAH